MQTVKINRIVADPDVTILINLMNEIILIYII